MAELVDALVSNTSGFTSMPVRSRLWVLQLFIGRTKSVLPDEKKNFINGGESTQIKSA